MGVFCTFEFVETYTLQAETTMHYLAGCGK